MTASSLEAITERLVEEALGRTIAKAKDPEEVLWKILWGGDPLEETSVIREAVEVSSRNDRTK